MRLREYTVTLRGEKVVLRPMTEADWGILLKWNNDPDVIYFSDGASVTGHSLESVHQIYRGVSQNAFCFIIELEGAPIGECWLQRMNLQRILDKYPEKDCRRIDLMIGEKRLWGKGLGTEVIRTLTRFGFEMEKADIIFGLVGGHNPRSVRAFEKAGYKTIATIENTPDSKSEYDYDLAITKEELSLT